MSEFYDKGLHFLGNKKIDVSIVVIGAMDGVSFDELSGYIAMYGWSGLFIEPIEYQFNKLVKYYSQLNYKPNNSYENCAVSSYNGEIEMLVINREAIDNGSIHPCFGGMSACCPLKNGLKSEGDAETVRKFGERIKAPCKTLETVLNKHKINHIDILQCDAEGHDWIILKQLDLSIYRPKLIRSEWINLTETEQTELLTHFLRFGYLYEVIGQDITLVDQHFWRAISN